MGAAAVATAATTTAAPCRAAFCCYLARAACEERLGPQPAVCCGFCRGYVAAGAAEGDLPIRVAGASVQGGVTPQIGLLLLVFGGNTSRS